MAWHIKYILKQSLGHLKHFNSCVVWSGHKNAACTGEWIVYVEGKADLMLQTCGLKSGHDQVKILTGFKPVWKRKRKAEEKVDTMDVI